VTFNYLLICDHASNRIPPEIGDIGVSADDMEKHIAYDIGTELLTMRLQSLLKCSAVMADWSRLLIDMNRDPKSPGLVPEVSDGITIPYNVGMTTAEKMQRMQEYYAPYHQRVSQAIDALEKPFLVAIHSFTPVMKDFERPWQIGFLWNSNTDVSLRAAEIMASMEPGFAIGLNQPYSGKTLNYTMDRHAERRGLPYLSIEIRQDLLDTPENINAWGTRLATLIEKVTTHANI
jgi:predicted N-formylglutamate amidohydrolase